MTGAPDTSRPERRLIALLSAKDKTPEQLSADAVEAIQRWQDAQQAPPADSD